MLTKQRVTTEIGTTEGVIQYTVRGSLQICSGKQETIEQCLKSFCRAFCRMSPCVGLVRTHGTTKWPKLATNIPEPVESMFSGDSHRLNSYCRLALVQCRHPCDDYGTKLIVQPHSH